MINRYLESIIEGRMGQGKAIVLLGARQVGKTTMLKNLLARRDDVLWLNGDEQDVSSDTNLQTAHTQVFQPLYPASYQPSFLFSY
jgi:predicted AAA+ superfamily ATPase